MQRYSRMAMCPSTTPGFSAMPPRVRSRVWSLIGMPQPALLPNMPTADMPTVLLLHMRKPALHPPENWPDDSEDHQRQPSKILETFPGLLHCIHLSRPNFLMNLSEGLLIRRSDNIDNGLLLASHVTLNQGRHVHLIKQDKVLPAFVTGMQRFVLVHCLCQTGDNECCERERLSGVRFMFPQELASPGHIDFDQATNHRIALD